MMFQPLIFALMCVGLGSWFGARQTWREGRAYTGLVIVAALAALIGMNGAMSVLGCIGLGLGFWWARRAS
jgi:hypothetical protein